MRCRPLLCLLVLAPVALLSACSSFWEPRAGEPVSLAADSDDCLRRAHTATPLQFYLSDRTPVATPPVPFGMPPVDSARQNIIYDNCMYAKGYAPSATTGASAPRAARRGEFIGR